MRSLLSFLISVLIVAAPCGYWWAFVRRTGSKGQAPLGDALVGAVLGLGGLSMALFVLVARGHAQRGTFYVLIGLCGLAGVAYLAHRLVSWLRERHGKLPSGSSLAGVALLVLLASAALIPALAPPSMSDWDSLAYHLSVPKLYIEHGGLHYISFMSHSNFPMLTEMLYVPGLALGDPVAAKLVHFWTGVMLVLTVILLVKRHFNPRAAVLAAIGVAGMPIVLWEATTAYIDLATALYTILCVYLLLNYLDKPARGSLVMCGLAAGFAASTKMTGLAAIPLIAIWLVADRYATERKIDWKGALGFVAIALAVCSPWYIKSLVYTGNPVYPFFYSIFGGRDWTAALAANYAMLQSHFGMGRGLASFLSLPYDLTFRSDAFYDTPGLYIGPILLVGVPVLLLGRCGSRKLVGLTLFFLAQIVVWFALTQQSRYLIPAFAILAVVLVEIVYRDERLKVARIALAGVFVATSLFGIWTLVPAITSAAPVVFGRETRDDYLSRTLDIYPAQQYMNENLPRTAKVALFGDTRGFYLDRDYVWADPGHNAEFTQEYTSVKEYGTKLRQVGVTHAMVNYRFFPPPDEAKGASRMLYEAIDSGALELIYPEGEDTRGVAVYRLR